MKRMILSLMAMVGVLTLSAQEIYDFKVMNDEGQEVSLSDYKGKVLLIVNTATPKRGSGDSRLPLQPVWRTGAWNDSGDSPVLHGKLRHPVPAVRQD